MYWVSNNYIWYVKRVTSILVLCLLVSIPAFSADRVTQALADMELQPVLWLVVKSFTAGLLAVFTPYMYTIHPFTIGYLTRNVPTETGKFGKTLIYAAALIIIFSLLGTIATTIIALTGVDKFTDHWLFNLFFFRIFLLLGISFLGAFAFKLPASWINALANKATKNNVKGIFIMAATLPAASFSSTFPIVGLVLLMAGKVPVVGPVIGLFFFGAGLACPFVFPKVMRTFANSKSLLNNIKVIMGFVSLMIALKFMSKADIDLELGLISRDMFIEIWLGLWIIMGIYMLGFVKMDHDTENEKNVYGQDYTRLSRLFIAMGAFIFAVYLLPGIWGAPLHGVSGFLP
jgi:MFS family permease